MELLDDYSNADTISIDTLALEESIYEERSKEIAELNQLSKRVYFLHTSLLYYRNPKTKMGSLCYEAWKTLVKRVGGAPRTWRDLGHYLEISVDDLDYIENSIKQDPTDIVLKIFRQKEDATLDKVLEAFVKMKRYDILKALESPLSHLASFFYKDESKSDTGYHSSSKERLKHPIVNLKNVPNDLPPVLSYKYDLCDEKRKEPIQPKIPSPQNNCENKVVKKGPILFLTFAEDGLETALNIKNKVKNWSEEFSQISVITLNDRKDDVLQNPEIFIRDYFEKADFIVPIVTEEYMNTIKSHSRNIPNTNDNLDFKYVGFIYTLMINYYLHATGCLNRKVRSIIPESVPSSIYIDISIYPDLLPWTNENSFDEVFKAYLKKLMDG